MMAHELQAVHLEQQQQEKQRKREEREARLREQRRLEAQALEAKKVRCLRVAVHGCALFDPTHCGAEEVGGAQTQRGPARSRRTPTPAEAVR